ncbi:MAG: 4-carboxy-4-hydroxy-2-oxoadipate aldolase/oxaloacetate decarboxylase [Streptosporangiaceae bacterium]
MRSLRGRHVIVRRIERADAAVVDRLAEVGAATLHEAIGRRGSLGPDLRPNQQDVRIAGPVVTASCHPGDNLMIHAAVECCQAGDVLVVANTASSTHGMFGEMLASSLMARRVRGVVLDGGTRDTAELRELGFPVWSRHVSVQGTVKASPGSVNVPLVFGGQLVSPGDVVCADDDGVVVVSRDEADWALERSLARLKKEEATRVRLEAGELGVDIYGLRDKLHALGVEYIDTPDDL